MFAREVSIISVRNGFMSRAAQNWICGWFETHELRKEQSGLLVCDPPRDSIIASNARSEDANFPFLFFLFFFYYSN